MCCAYQKAIFPSSFFLLFVCFFVQQKAQAAEKDQRSIIMFLCLAFSACLASLWDWILLLENQLRRRRTNEQKKKPESWVWSSKKQKKTQNRTWSWKIAECQHRPVINMLWNCVWNFLMSHNVTPAKGETEASRGDRGGKIMEPWYWNMKHSVRVTGVWVLSPRGCGRVDVNCLKRQFRSRAIMREIKWEMRVQSPY